jgi:hypothetical protein
MVEYSEEIERGNPNGHFGVRIFGAIHDLVLATCEGAQRGGSEGEENAVHSGQWLM